MTKPTLSSYLRDHVSGGARKTDPGPYLTISRQYGCDGIEMGQSLAERLNERDDAKRWKVYDKEFIRQLSEDTGVDEALLDRERVSKPSLFKDFCRGLNKNPVPDRMEIRNKVGLMIRAVAVGGYSIIMGQGGAMISNDIANGLTIRLEAPRDWRIARLCQSESLTRQAAAMKIDRIDAELLRLRMYYDQKAKRNPEFHLVFDNAKFSKEIIAELVLMAMEEKKMIEKLS